MAISAEAIDEPAFECDACRGAKAKPVVVRVQYDSAPLADVIGNFDLCSECAKDMANAIGFIALSSGWSKLEARKRKAVR